MRKFIFALALVASSAVYAGGSICPVYEYAELQSFSDDELFNKQTEMIDKNGYMKHNYYGDDTAAEIESQNCRTQIERIKRITDARFAKKISEIKAAKAAAAQTAATPK